jgi:hypothetical protein
MIDGGMSARQVVHPRIAALLACVVLTSTAARGADDPVPSDPEFIATTTDGATVAGRLSRLDLAANTLSLRPSGAGAAAGADDRELKLDAVVSLARRGVEPIPLPPEGSVVVFPDGDRLRGLIGTATDAEVKILPQALADAETPVPLGSILGLIFEPPTDDDDASWSLFRRVRDNPRDAEVLWLANGDRLEGSLLALEPDAVRFQPDTGPVAIPRASVLALGFAPALVKYPRPDGVYVELTFTDGSRLGVSSLRLESGRLIAQTRFGAEIRPDLKAVARINVRAPGLIDLASITPAAAQYVGYLGRHPETFGRDTTWDGHPLRLAGQPHDRGLGTLPRTLLAYRLDGAARRFQATIGVDDRAGPLASVIFRVLVDGKEKYASPALDRRSGSIPVDVDIAGAKLLILVTEFGDRGDVQDVADWAEARLIR